MGAQPALTETPAQLDAAPGNLHFSARVSAPGVLEQIILVRNSGGSGPLGFNASVLGGSSWISDVTPSRGETAHNAPVILRVHVNTQGLQVGSYHDVIRLVSSGGNIDIPVALFVGNRGPILGVDVTGLTFHVRSTDFVRRGQTIRVLNLGDPGTIVNWTVPHLSSLIIPGTAGDMATPENPGLLTITPEDALFYPSGSNYVLIDISAPGSLNSPQYVLAVLDVESNTSPVLPDPSPAGLFFTGVAGGPVPAVQQVTIHASDSAPFQAAVSSINGGNWLSASPAAGFSGPITVSANSAGLPPGIYRGEVNILMSGAVSSMNVTLVVQPAGTLTALGRAATSGCTSSKLTITQTRLVNNFSIPAKWPAPLTVQLDDDCGAPVANGLVVASFSNGDPPLSLQGDGVSGRYSATWQPGSVTSRMAVTLQATAGSLPSATVQLNGAVIENQAPVLAKGGTVNAFYRTAGALAPGTVAEVCGSDLAVSPFPNQPSQTLVVVGDYRAPLFYLSNGQLDVPMPMELVPTQQYAVAVAVNDAYTLPDQIDVVALQPGISAFADGHIIAQHVDGTLIDATHPAKPGEAIVTYALGMGPTNPTVETGLPSPASPLAVVITQPVVMVDGQAADVLFAGLTPGYAGLYQINFSVPESAQPGDLTVVVTQNGIASNATKLPVSQ